MNEIADVTDGIWPLRDEAWIELGGRHASHDHLHEVPDRLLARWRESRRRHGALLLEDLIEIARLPQAQLDARGMAEAARELWGLEEWPLAAGGAREHLRYLARFTPEQRARATGEGGLPLPEMWPAQREGFLALLAGTSGSEPAPELLVEAALRVDYTTPGGYEWRVPGPSWLSWVVPLEPGPKGRRVFCPAARGETREAALAALGRVDFRIRAAVLRTARRADPRLRDAPPPDELQIAPTSLRLAFTYLPGATNRREFVTCVATERGCRVTRARS